VDVISRVTELFDSACIGQFESLGCVINLVEHSEVVPNEAEFITSFIEAESKDLSVKLFLASPCSLLTETMPLVDDRSIKIPEFQEDWNLELANRFLGRLKNKLLSHGCVLNMGLPEKSSYEAMEVERQEGEESAVRLFQIQHESNQGMSHDVMQCSLLVRVHNQALCLLDHEDEDEAWFEESELEHL